MKTFKPFHILFILYLLTGCNGETYDFGYRKIDEKLVSDFSDKSWVIGTEVLLHSAGGRTSSALKISMVFEKSSLKLVINSACMSACADILLPSAASIRFENTPIIGFHWDNSMSRKLLERNTSEGLELCNWELEEKYQNLLKEAGLKQDFWKDVEKRLVLKRYRVIPKKNECPWKDWEFENQMWLPTSQQLREIWGLKFKGKVCADDFTKCSKRIDINWPKGTRIVVGDEIHISKGR